MSNVEKMSQLIDKLGKHAENLKKDYEDYTPSMITMPSHTYEIFQDYLKTLPAPANLKSLEEFKIMASNDEETNLGEFYEADISIQMTTPEGSNVTRILPMDSDLEFKSANA